MLLSEYETVRSIGDRKAATASTAMSVTRNERVESPRSRGGRLPAATVERARKIRLPANEVAVTVPPRRRTPTGRCRTGGA